MNNRSKKKVASVTDSVFVYSSTCCNEPANKPPCIATKEERKTEKGKTFASVGEASLGTWRCSRCKRKCSVTRSRRKAEVIEEAAA